MITTLRKMMSQSVRLMDKISHALELDIFWRILCSLPQQERFHLALRVLQDDVDKMVFRKNGVLWTGYSWDSSIAWPLLVDGHYQGREIDALISWMKEHGRLESDQKVIIEVGANIGTTSIPLTLSTNCHILAIEPVPENLSLLRENVMQNGLQDRVTCIQKAISRQPGTTQMVLAKYRCGGSAIKQEQPNFTLPGGQTGYRSSNRQPHEYHRVP
ncbi:MAG: FkbM family methyltransferase [bacterium]